MNKNPKDTVITIRHQNFDFCGSKTGFCVNHPNKIIILHSSEIESDSAQDPVISDSIQSEAPKIVIPEKKPLKEKIELTAFDSITPCSEKYLQSGDSRSASEFIEIPEAINQMEKKKDLNAEIFGLTFGFLIFISLKYLIYNSGNWKSMYSEIKEILYS